MIRLVLLSLNFVFCYTRRDTGEQKSLCRSRGDSLLPVLREIMPHKLLEHKMNKNIYSGK